MKKFLAALLGSSLVFGLAGCKIEILDKDEDNTEDKDEGVTPNPNPNPDSGESNGDGDVETPQFETLQDALDYLNGDIGNCEMLMFMDMSMKFDIDEDGVLDEIPMISSEITGSIDANIVYQFDKTTSYFPNPDGDLTEEYSYRVTNEDGSETVYVSVDNENWSIEESDTEPEGWPEMPGLDFGDLKEEDFNHEYGKYTTKDSVTEELGMQLVIMLVDENFVVEFTFDQEMADEESGVAMIVKATGKMSNFGKVSLTLPTVSE